MTDVTTHTPLDKINILIYIPDFLTIKKMLSEMCKIKKKTIYKYKTS